MNDDICEESFGLSLETRARLVTCLFTTNRESLSREFDGATGVRNGIQGSENFRSNEQVPWDNPLTTGIYFGRF